MRKRIISDTHFWHDKMIEWGLRKPWFNKKIFNLLMKIPKDDLLIHLWDVCMGKDSYWHIEYIQKLKCKKILIMWNHDRKNAYWYMNHWWDFACTRHIEYLDKYKIILSHQPEQQLPSWWLNIHWYRHEKVNPPFSDNHFCYSPELENYKPKELKDCLQHYPLNI